MLKGKHGGIPGALLALIAFLAMSLLTGCSGSPEQTVIKMSKADSGNEVKRYLSQRLINEIESTGVDFDEVVKPDPGMATGMDASPIEYTTETLESEINGDTARVWHKDMDFFIWVLIKEGNTWKIDDLDMDFEAMMEGLSDMMEGIDMENLQF